MALYEYQCAKCRRKTEVIQRFSDPAPTKCPHCGGALTKLLSSPAVQFKGSGFYATDYGKSGGKQGDFSRGKEDDSSKSQEGGGAPSEAAAETKSGSEGDSSKEKKDSGPAAASDGTAAKASTAPSSPSRKRTRRK